MHRVTSAPLRVRLVGRFVVEGVGSEEPPAIPSGRAQRLLCVLAAHHGRFVSTTTIIGALWSDRPPERPDRNLAALVSRLRRSLGRERIAGDPTGYRLVRDPSTLVDVYEGLDLVEEAERDLDRGLLLRAVSVARSAEDLLGRGTPLAGEADAPWVQEIRHLVGPALGRARAAHWTAALGLGEDRTAIDLAGRALAADALDEPACRALMRAHIRQGSDGAALAAYGTLRHALAEELGADPSPATQEIYHSLLRHDDHDDREGELPRMPLRGRDRELALLRRAWAGASRGHGGLVLVSGEAGIGKSALVRTLADEVSTRDARTPVVDVRCYEAERSLYLQPLAEAVREVVTRFPAEATPLLHGTELQALADLAPGLGDPGQTPATPEVGRRRTLLAMAELFGRMAEVRPILLVVEDLHRAGQTTVEALHVLATRLATRRVLVVATERTAEERSGTESLLDVATHLAVGPLAREAVTAVLAASGVGYDPERFFAWTGGSPLLVSELLRHPEPAPADGSGPVIPGSLHEMLTRRLAAAAEDVALLVSQAAVLGSSFSLDDAAALAGIGPEECARRAGRAVRAGLLAPDGERFRFPNDIVRAVAYSRAELPVRISRHRRAAELFADRPEAAAPHHSAAGDHRAAALDWIAAADAAHLVFAHLEAERLLCSALASAARTGRRRAPHDGAAAPRPGALRPRPVRRRPRRPRRGPRPGPGARRRAARGPGARGPGLDRAVGARRVRRRRPGGAGRAPRRVRRRGPGRPAQLAAAARAGPALGRRLRGRHPRLPAGARGGRRRRPQRGGHGLPGRPAPAHGPLRRGPRGPGARGGAVRPHRRVPDPAAEPVLLWAGARRRRATSPARCARWTAARRLIDDAGVGYYRAGHRDDELLALAGARRPGAGARARRDGGRSRPAAAAVPSSWSRNCTPCWRSPTASCSPGTTTPRARWSRPRSRCSARRCPSGRGPPCACSRCRRGGTRPRAEELLDSARTYRSAKYEALALAHLGRTDDAAAAAARSPLRPRRRPGRLPRAAQPGARPDRRRAPAPTCARASSRAGDWSGRHRHPVT